MDGAKGIALMEAKIMKLCSPPEEVRLYAHYILNASISSSQDFYIDKCPLVDAADNSENKRRCWEENKPWHKRKWKQSVKRYMRCLRPCLWAIWWEKLIFWAYQCPWNCICHDEEHLIRIGETCKKWCLKIRQSHRKKPKLILKVMTKSNRSVTLWNCPWAGMGSPYLIGCTCSMVWGK